MNLSKRARDLVVEITSARRLPLMARAVVAERLTAEAAVLILELAETVEVHAAKFEALLSAIEKINAAFEARRRGNRHA